MGWFIYGKILKHLKFLQMIIENIRLFALIHQMKGLSLGQMHRLFTSGILLFKIILRTSN